MKKTLLFVDDKDTIAKILSFYLAADYNMVYHTNPIEAIKWLKSNDLPDLIISDIRMPEMKGDEFLIYLKSKEEYKHIPVIMLSSEDSTSERIRLLEAGADDYIVKPFNPAEIKVRVAKIMNFRK